MKEYFRWKNKCLDDADLNKELDSIEGNDKEIYDRFRCDLEFGTGGLRGLIGAGTNRMNVYTVGRATQGLASSLIANNNGKSEGLSVVIAHDSRNKGELFTERAASVLAANGIKVYVFDELAPTPELSFAVRYTKSNAGICVTASHNPAVYNGYKVYGDDGCQIGPVLATSILNVIASTDIFDGVKLIDYKEAVNKGLVEVLKEDVFTEFMKCVKNENLLKNKVGEKLKVVYTPLNGTGRKGVIDVLSNDDAYELHVVKEQELPDGNFPTCPYPNPENPEAIKLALDLCEKVNADVMIATDPDCDRCRAAAKGKNGYEALSGNQTGVLLMDYLASSRKKVNGEKKPVVVTTIVSTPMVDRIANEYGLEMRRVLTGFKYIGEQIGLLEKDNEEDRYMLGFEESCGYLTGTYVRDKDAVSASLLICEAASYYKQQGLDLYDVLNNLWKEFGFFGEKTLSFEFKGYDGKSHIKNIMKSLRNNFLNLFENFAVYKVENYLNSKTYDALKNKEVPSRLPVSNIISFELENNCKIIVRPSGTEPKIKFYIMAYAENSEKLDQLKNQLEEEVKNLLKTID